MSPGGAHKQWHLESALVLGRVFTAGLHACRPQEQHAVHAGSVRD